MPGVDPSSGAHRPAEPWSPPALRPQPGELQRWLSEVCAIRGITKLKGNGAHQKLERKDKCKDCLNPAIAILLLMCSALFSL